MTKPTGKPRGRPPKGNHQWQQPRMPPGARDRLNAVLAEGETMSDFMRSTLMAEIERREKRAKAFASRSVTLC
jgi:hypothetical protein